MKHHVLDKDDDTNSKQTQTRRRLRICDSFEIFREYSFSSKKQVNINGRALVKNRFSFIFVLKKKIIQVLQVFKILIPVITVIKSQQPPVNLTKEIMTNKWRKVEDENGFPYYFNEVTKITQWDHPKFEEIHHKLDECNDVKDARYRVAMKFRVLQQCLYMEEVHLNTIRGVFDRHKLGVNESSLCLESSDLEAVLSDIYFATNKQDNRRIDIDLATDLMQNFLYNVYDRGRAGKIHVLSTKLVLALLCKCELQQLYHFIFKLCSDHNNCITRLRFQTILIKLVEISNLMHEDVNFGQHLVNNTIEMCFEKSPGLVGITESNFITWLEQAPLLFSWIPILHRIKATEFVVHPSKCSTCKTSPLMGLRYKCVKCSKYTQCQQCFFKGRISGSHKATHSMKEYCNKDSNRLTFNIFKKFCGILPCSSTNVNNNNNNNNNNSNRSSCVIETKPMICERDVSSKSIPNNNSNSTNNAPHEQLKIVIKQLEDQNEELQRIILLGNHNGKEMRKYLEGYKNQIALQILNLRILFDSMNHSGSLQRNRFIESTPAVRQPARHKTNQQFSNIDLLSPIRQNDGNINDSTPHSLLYSVNDISTWIGGRSLDKTNDDSGDNHENNNEFQNGLDDALAKLQQILANNFTLDESLGTVDNSDLKNAVCEVEDMITSIIDSVETSRASSVQH